MSRTPKISHHVASGAERLRHVFVRDLAVEALLGIYPQEKTNTQRVVINIDLSVKEGDNPLADDIRNVVSYEIVVKKVEEIVAKGHVGLAETLAELIAAACLTDKRVMAARVRVEKPDVIKNARSVGVEIERLR
jgi:7,8-dihydroneopterin aldolase/epimerase/oxygenase